MERGTVVFLSSSETCGFIRQHDPSESRHDLYFDIESIKNTDSGSVSVGDVVEYVKDPDSDVAWNIHVVGDL